MEPSNRRGAYGSAWAARSRRVTGSGNGLGISHENGFDSETGHSPREGETLSSVTTPKGAAAAFTYASNPSSGPAPAASPQGHSGTAPIALPQYSTLHSRSASNSGGASGDSDSNSGGVSTHRQSSGEATLLQPPQTNNTNHTSGLPRAARALGTDPRSPVASPGPLGRPGFPGGVASTPPTQPVRWKKALYERQPFDDNYVDPERFLADMRKNANLKEYHYLEIVRDMFALVQQLSITVIFVVVYQAVHEQWISRGSMIALNALMLSASMLVYVAIQHQEGDGLDTATRKHALPTNNQLGVRGWLQPAETGGGEVATSRPREHLRVHSAPADAVSSHDERASSSRFGETGGPTRSSRAGSSVHPGSARPATTGFPGVGTPSPTKLTFFGCARQGVIFSLLLLLLAPIFKTLTETYTTDTIRALCVGLFFVYNVFADYDYLNGYSRKFGQNIAGNAALFATVLLASRIQSPSYASTLVGVGVQLFTLSPIVRHSLKSVAVEAHVALTFTLCGIAIGCLIGHSPLLAGVFVTTVISVVLVVPWAFVEMQRRYKFQINGPWDEARPLNSTAAAEWANSGLLS